VDQNQHGAAARLGTERAASSSLRTFRPLEDHDLHCGAALRPDQRALGHRRPHQWRTLHALRREGVGANPVKGRGRYPQQPRQSQGKAARNAIRATGAHLLFLPPYSPDLNPIEQLFAKLKHLIRAAEPRDVEATWRKVGELLNLFSPQECANYLKNSGYVSV